MHMATNTWKRDNRKNLKRDEQKLETTLSDNRKNWSDE